MFVGRESELIKLEKMYSTNEFQFAVIYGRRRVGKTTLIREFLKNKESLKQRKAEGRYKPTKAEWAATIREHRRYKEQLKKKGDIK